MAPKKPASTPHKCPIVDTLKQLREQLRATESAPTSQRVPLAAAARIVTEIHLGRGKMTHLAELGALAQELSSLDSETARLLSHTLAQDDDVWLRHVREHQCDTKACMQPHTVPCQVACPTHIDIPSMIAHVGRGQYSQSLDVLLKDTPLPNSCGLICPAPCEDACVQNAVSAPVVIKPMKSVAARCSGGYRLPFCAAPSGKRVAVVGSGPAGLTAAYYLAQKGHQVDIFDERPEAGGIMRYGIPNYRLPLEVLNTEIDMIKALGVSIHTDHAVKNVVELRERGFDATFLAIGLQSSRRLGIPGDTLPFVLGGMDFLRKVRNGENPQVGPKVIVIGGGNVAIDVAMTCFRQGATQVQIWYRRTRKDMPANAHEVDMAMAEGVELFERWTPSQVLPDNRIEFTRSPNAPDAGTASPVIVHADHVISGIGQDSELRFLEGSRLEVKAGAIGSDPTTLMTAEHGIFAGGDITLGAGTVVAAIGSGKRAAESIHAYLSGNPMDHDALLPQRRDFVLPLGSDATHRTDPDRPRIPEKEPLLRRTSHEAIQFDFNEDVARQEAERCLRCDLCIGCGLCELACVEIGAEALRMVDTGTGRLVFDGFLRPATMCIGCGACAAVCPTGAITVETIGNERITTITGTVVRKQPLLPCAVCGTPYVTAMQFEGMREPLGLKADDPCVCPTCARQATGGMLQAIYP